MAIFSIKANDTRPILEVSLKNPDGTAHDLTGATAFTLHVQLSPSVVFTRALVKQGLDTDGVLRYTWLASDWSGTAPVLPVPTSVWQIIECPMEYEVVAGTSRMTFPNDGYDKLQIISDLT